ncbi:MAG TPA: LuxR C-terminal-related transcriptional regulator [Ktedonobacteraceae bacterium]
MESAKQSSERSPLPVYLTRFVGREQECNTLSSLLLSKRLLMLVGAGGIGKTRLALEVASELTNSFSDGVYMIELASLADPQLVPQAIASVLNIRTDRDVSLISFLKSALGERHVLLLLDNCEHVLTECAPLVEALLQASPHLHILGTSREPLGITGETIWRVAPLSSPDPEQNYSVEQLAGYEAIQLFCERAAESNPRFRLTQQNAPAIVHTCRQLDGLPLALELAAALLPMLSVDQLAARLDERFVLLKHGRRTAGVRQQSLQATLDWSYALLTPAEQALFPCLAIFAGSWDLDAVEQVCTPVIPETFAIVETLVQLVNKSLVVAEEQEGLERDTTEVRYRLLDTMQQYALEKLEQRGALQQAGERHYTWCLELAERADEHLYGADQVMWLQRLEMETANLRVALTRMLTAGRLDAVARLADALRRFWITHNHFSEGRYWFDMLLTTERDEQRLSPPLRARVLFGAAGFARYQGAYERACALLEEQIALLETLNDRSGIAEAQTYLGLALGLQGDFERGISLCSTGLEFYRSMGQHKGSATALTTLAFLKLAQGHYAQAMTLSEEACQLLREAGNHVHLLYALFTLAQAALLLEATERAREVCREALGLARTQEQTYGIAACLGLIGGLAGMEGKYAVAARLFGAAQALQERVQAPHPPAGRALLERMVRTIIATSGREQFFLHFSAGQASPLEQILLEAEEVLQTAPTSPASSSLTSSVSTALAVLSPREREILTLVATGLTDAQVAGHLYLSTRTVSKHLQSIYTKLNIKSRSAATRLAFEHGLV